MNEWRGKLKGKVVLTSAPITLRTETQALLQRLYRQGTSATSRLRPRR